MLTFSKLGKQSCEDTVTQVLTPTSETPYQIIGVYLALPWVL